MILKINKKMSRTTKQPESVGEKRVKYFVIVLERFLFKYLRQVSIFELILESFVFKTS